MVHPLSRQQGLILALESSCDETAVALVSETGAVIGEALATQIETHRLYGGVVPEVASRAHFEVLDSLVLDVLQRTGVDGRQLRAVAVTKGPGLVGPLLVGVSYAQGLAAGWGVPLLGVHHLRGHLASSLLGLDDTALRERAAAMFPALVLLVSGGHTQVLRVGPRLEAEAWADTADDAAGECFDKSAKLMGLPYPGGPSIERLALAITPGELPRAQEIFQSLPRPRSSEGYSFSGLKTAIRLKLQGDSTLATSPAFAWAVQEAIGATLLAGLKRSFDAKATDDLKTLVFCGGVAANRRLRTLVSDFAKQRGLALALPPLKYCTDNAVMIAAAAWVQSPTLGLDDVHARIPL